MLQFARTSRHPPYEYPNISSRPSAFRLVKLLPPLRTLFSDTVRIQLITVDDASAVAHDTLSYTWGVKSHHPPNRIILIETLHGPRELRIHGPLETALKNIKTDRPLFVDQICINQADDVEKASQVKLMHDIYAQCTQFLVWLGPRTRSSDTYFDCVRQISEESTLSRISGPRKSTFLDVFDAVMDPTIPVTGSIQEDRDDVLELLAKYGDAFPLQGAVDVLDRPWFRRLWIIQEVSLAPTVLFQCGSRNLCFDCFRMGMLFYTIYNTHWATNVKESVSRQDVARRDYIYTLNQSPMRLFQERRAIHELGARQSLYDLVIKYNASPGNSRTKATLAEDRVFGLMGMADPQSLQGLVVNYDDTRRVYIESASILARENLDLLLYSQFPKKVANLPSWTPDWSMDLNLPHGYLKLKTPSYSAGGERRSAPTVNTSAGHLVVRGILVDTILEKGQRQVMKDADTVAAEHVDCASLPRYFDEIDEFIAKSHVSNDHEMVAIRLGDFGSSSPLFIEKYGDAAAVNLKNTHSEIRKWGQKLINTHEATLSFRITRIVGTVGVLPWYWVPASTMDYFQFWAREPLKALKTWIKAVELFLSDVVALSCASAVVYLMPKLLRLRRRFSRLKFHDPRQDEVLRRVGIDPKVYEDQKFANYSECLLRNMDQRVYVTQKGYIGTGPVDMEPGDVVVVVFGVTVPVILRKIKQPNGQETWSYLGETYCEGIMNGEVLNNEETIFTLI